MAALKFQLPIGNSVVVGAEIGTPLAQDCQNSDGSVVATDYFGDLFVTGKF